MICNNCGKEIEQGAFFCSFCGTKAVPPQPVTEIPVTAASEAPAIQNTERAIEETAAEVKSEPLSAVNSASAAASVTAPAPTSAPAPTMASTPTPAPAPAPIPVQTRGYNGFSQPVPPPPPIPYTRKRKPEKPPKTEKPKTFFGKGALALCLIIIGILSCSTTVFATLFFTLLGRI